MQIIEYTKHRLLCMFVGVLKILLELQLQRKKSSTWLTARDPSSEVEVDNPLKPIRDSRLQNSSFTNIQVTWSQGQVATLDSFFPRYIVIVIRPPCVGNSQHVQWTTFQRKNGATCDTRPVYLICELPQETRLQGKWSTYLTLGQGFGLWVWVG